MKVTYDKDIPDILCYGKRLTVDLFRDGKLVKKDEVLQMTQSEDMLINGRMTTGFDLAQLARDSVSGASNADVRYFIGRKPQVLESIEWSSNSLSTWLVNCKGVDSLTESYVAINLVKKMMDGCAGVLTLTVDLFFNDKLIKRDALLTPVYTYYDPYSGNATDLLEAAQRYMDPEKSSLNMMGKVYVSNTRPANLATILWSSVATHKTPKVHRLYGCAEIRKYQSKYVAINIAPACEDTTLRADVYWRGELLKKNQVLNIIYKHGERRLGESRVDLAKVARSGVASTLLPSDDTLIQFFSSSTPITGVIDWSKRRKGVPRLVAGCQQIDMLRTRHIYINVMPVVTIDGLKCSLCSCFDAAFHNQTKNEFYCSKQCCDDSLAL